MQKIKQNDEVIILTGKDKKQRGKVLRVVKAAGKVVKVLVEGVNKAKKHVRPNPQLNQKGGIIEREMPLHVSNVALYNPATKKADRVGIRILEDGRKVRYFKSNGEIIDL